VLSAAGRTDLFVARVDSAARFRWVSTAGGAGSDEGHAVAAGPGGRISVTGVFGGSLKLAGVTLELQGGTWDRDLLVAGLDSGGKFLWAARGGGTTEDLPGQVGLDDHGCTLVGGSFRGGGVFARWSMSSTAGAQDALIWKLGRAGP
jgi:hypothetical protein